MKLSRKGALLRASVAVATAAAIVGVYSVAPKTPTPSASAPANTETMYVQNFAQKYISDAVIKHDIPAWEQAVNVDERKFWHNTAYKLVFIGRAQAPAGADVAKFVVKGPVKGALAYHDVVNGSTAITVYAGTGAYYGYNNSVSFTHELEEAAADPDISTVKQGWPYDYYWLEKSDGSLKQVEQFGVLGWYGEVSDPVEADSYTINGVAISDFITPAWFNAGGGSRYDFMGVCPQPFWIKPGGYAQYEDALGWNLIANWRGAGRDAKGFYLGDPREPSRK